MKENERLIETMEEMLELMIDKKESAERIEHLKQKIVELRKTNESIKGYPSHVFKKVNKTLKEFCKQFSFDNMDKFHIEELESYNIRIIDKLGKALDVTQMMDLVMIEDKTDNFKKLMIQNNAGIFVDYQ